MPTKTTVGQLLIEDALPREYRGRGLTFDKKGLAKFLNEIATTRPELYKDISHKLVQLGRDASFDSGGYSFGLRHLSTSPAGVPYREQVRRDVSAIMARTDLSQVQKEREIIRATGQVRSAMEKAIYEEGLAEGNPLALQIASGAKGNPGNLRSLRGADLLYVDNNDRDIPIPVLRSYAEGLSPAEYFAGAFGARRGVTEVKTGTAEGGFLAKRLGQMTHRLVVTARDADTPSPADRPVGLSVETADPDNEGAYLASAAGSYPRNTLLTSRVLADLRAKGHEHILVRTPMAGGPPDGGVYSYDVGVRERGAPAPVGDYVGLAAAQALSEPLTQSRLSSKHTGGISGATGVTSGFRLYDQLFSIPQHFPSGATHAQRDGRVESVETSPQGGHYVTVAGERHYVPHGITVTAKPGDEVEAGDTLSSGIPNPAELVRHKGVGEGRRRFVDYFTRTARAQGVQVHRRNVELAATGLINHVRLHEELGEHSPDDIVPYRTIESSWEPRPGHERLSPRKALGRYLEAPVLHYSIGTVVRPSMLPLFERHGVTSVLTHREPPPFEPVMVRSHDTLAHDPDWMTRMLGSNLEKHLLRGAHLGHTSDRLGTSFVPALAEGLHFGVEGKTKGWDPKDLGKTTP